MNVSRRGFLGTCLSVTAVAAGLSACNSSASLPESEASPSAGGVEEGAFPVTIAHKFGETTLSQAPQRVVSAGLKEQDDLLALGVVPVAATRWLELGKGGIVGEWAESALGSAPVPAVLSITDGIELEKIAAQAPDLILALYSGLTQADYDKLSKIAPVVAQPKDVVDYGVAWDVQALSVGRAVGQPKRMQELVDASKKAVADAAAANPSFAGKTALVATPYEGIYVYGSQDPRSRLMTELGFRLPSDIDKMTGTAGFGGNISAEKQEFLDTDVLLWFADPKEEEEIRSDKVYSQLRVSKEGRDIFSATGDRMNNVFSFVTVLSLPYLLEQVVPRVQAAVDGDPETGTDQA
jgi:iron complex transport system substrate-binding protein